jgi:hypothetical protein
MKGENRISFPKAVERCVQSLAGVLGGSLSAFWCSGTEPFEKTILFSTGRERPKC